MSAPPTTGPCLSPYHLTPEARAALAQRAAEMRADQAEARARRLLQTQQPHLDALQQRRVLAQLAALRAGLLSTWPAGCTHLPGVTS